MSTTIVVVVAIARTDDIMCPPKTGGSPTFEGKGVKLSCGQIRAFVDGHNSYRYQVAQGLAPGQPAAFDMKYIVWDEELAEKATIWSENGIFGHNPDKTIWSKRWDVVGENVFVSRYFPPSNVHEPVDVVPNIEEALAEWFGEHKNYGFQPFQLGTPLPIGHYTQMVWADSTRVGCGISQRKENGYTESLFVCNYGPTGNYLTQVPYTRSLVRGFLWCPKGGCDRLYGHYC